MESIPSYVSSTFLAVVIALFAFLFYALTRAAPQKNNFTPTVATTFLVVWLFIIAILTYFDFLSDTESFPPRLIILVLPSFIAITVLFSLRKSREFIANMPLSTLTFLHIIRVPVEIVIFWLASYNTMPTVITFEGANLDIISGITAPFAGIFLVGMRSKSRYGAIIWNLVTLGLLINVVVRAVAATPYFAPEGTLDSMNIAVLYFPYVLLPTFVVPAVLFAHLASLYQLFFTDINKVDY